MVILNDYVNIYLTTWDYASNVLLSEKRRAGKQSDPFLQKERKKLTEHGALQIYKVCKLCDNYILLDWYKLQLC